MESPQGAPRHLIETVGVWQLDALVECLRFMVHRDEMNAAVHCSTARWSPLTHRVATAIDSSVPKRETSAGTVDVRDWLRQSDVALLDKVVGRRAATRQEQENTR